MHILQFELSYIIYYMLCTSYIFSMVLIYYDDESAIYLSITNVLSWARNLLTHIWSSGAEFDDISIINVSLYC